MSKPRIKFSLAHSFKSTIFSQFSKKMILIFVFLYVVWLFFWSKPTRNYIYGSRRRRKLKRGKRKKSYASFVKFLKEKRESLKKTKKRNKIKLKRKRRKKRKGKKF